MDPLRLRVAGNYLEVGCNNIELSAFLDEELSAFASANGKAVGSRVEIDFEWADGSMVRDSLSGEYRFLLPGKTALSITSTEADGKSRLGISAFPAAEPDDNSRRFLYSFILNYLLNYFLQQRNREQEKNYLMIHACGAVSDGAAFLFTGASGAGKSTVAHDLMGMDDVSVLGDDMVILIQDETGWTAFGSPLGGDVPRSELTNESAPLMAILKISQGENIEQARLAVSEATQALLSAVVPVYPIKYNANQQLSEYDSSSLDLLLENAATLAAEIPCFTLRLPLEDRNWQDIFQSIREEVANG